MFNDASDQCLRVSFAAHAADDAENLHGLLLGHLHLVPTLYDNPCVILDIRTVLTVTGLLCVVHVFALVYIYCTRKTYPGFGYWISGFVCAVITAALPVIRDQVSPWVSVVPATPAISAACILFLVGMQLYVGDRPRWLWHILVLVGGTAEAIWFTFVSPDINVRIAVVTVIMAVYCGYIAWLAHVGMPRILGCTDPWVVGSFGAQALVAIGRLIGTLGNPPAMNEFASNAPTQVLALVAHMLLAMLTGYGFILMTVQRTERELQQTLDEVKTLRGLIPICASCKKVRDDRGSWQAIEQYIRARSDAEFTHGVCPDCHRRLYPEIPLRQ